MLITGANRGIGLAYAEALIDAGVGKLYATARRPETLQAFADKHPDKIVTLALDLTQTESIAAAASAAEDVDIVINNGGVLTPGDALDPGVFDKLDYAMDVNVKGLLRIAQAFVPVLKARGGGALVQLNSIASLRNFAHFTTYCMSKAAAYSATQGLHDLLKDQGIEVYSVHPGPIDTDMGDEAGFVDAPSASIVPEASIAAMRAGKYHCFPDDAARQFYMAYKVFATHVVEKPLPDA